MRYGGKEVLNPKGVTMAWGIAMTAFTLIGMLVLLIAGVQEEEPRFTVHLGTGPRPATFPDADVLGEPRSDGETKKAA